MTKRSKETTALYRPRASHERRPFENYVVFRGPLWRKGPPNLSYDNGHGRGGYIEGEEHQGY